MATSIRRTILSRDGTIPPKSIWSYVLMLFPYIFVFRFVRKLVIKLAMKHCVNCDFDPGFRFYYGDHIYAKNVYFSNAFLMDYSDIVIGDGSEFCKNCMVITAKHNLINRKEIIAQPVSIDRNVYVETGAIILGGVHIGENAVVGSGSVVTKNIPKNCLIIGNPARVVKRYR